MSEILYAVNNILGELVSKFDSKNLRSIYRMVEPVAVFAEPGGIFTAGLIIGDDLNRLTVSLVAVRKLNDCALILKDLKRFNADLAGASECTSFVATAIKNGMGSQMPLFKQIINDGHDVKASIREVIDVASRTAGALYSPPEMILQYFKMTEIADRWGVATFKGKSANWLRSASTFLTRLDVANIASELGSPRIAGRFLSSLGDLADLAPPVKWSHGDLTNSADLVPHCE
jgi:hypothetical protein